MAKIRTLADACERLPVYASFRKSTRLGQVELESCKRKYLCLLSDEAEGLGEGEPPWTWTVEEETMVDLAKRV